MFIILRGCFFYCFIVIFLSACTSTRVKHTDLVYWPSAQAMKRLIQSNYRVDFPRLANQYQNQMDGMLCGPTTGAIVLNALKLSESPLLKTPQAGLKIPQAGFNETYKKHLPKNYDPRIQRYTPKNFMSDKIQTVKSFKQLYGEPIKGKKDFGLQLRQLHEIFILHGVKSKLRVVGKKLSQEEIKKELLDNLKRQGDYVIVNYKRSAMGQKGPGHISPLGAYDQITDSFLIMDVNSSRYDWVWIKSEILIKAMRTFDMVENRGYLLVWQ